jgi:hypothetical protein
MQCDRHGQNVYVDSIGHLTLIDLDQALGDAWRVCGVDSLFLPTTQKHTINVLGYGYTMKMATAPHERFALQHALDYRCHVAGGVIGVNYPPLVMKCLSAISSMTPSEVRPRETILPVCSQIEPLVLPAASLQTR